MLADRGIDISSHQSRQLEPGLVKGADLVLGMTRAHAREAIVRAPEAFARTFTVKELVRRAGIAGARQTGEPLDQWLVKVAGARKTSDLMGNDATDDIADPIGQPRKVYEETTRELELWLGRLVEATWPEAAWTP